MTYCSLDVLSKYLRLCINESALWVLDIGGGEDLCGFDVDTGSVSAASDGGAPASGTPAKP
jgi:hypothetical protein